MRLKSIQQLEDLGVADYTDLHVWTPALGGIYHGEKSYCYVSLITPESSCILTVFHSPTIKC